MERWRSDTEASRKLPPPKTHGNISDEASFLGCAKKSTIFGNRKERVVDDSFSTFELVRAVYEASMHIWIVGVGTERQKEAAFLTRAMIGNGQCPRVCGTPKCRTPLILLVVTLQWQL